MQLVVSGFKWSFSSICCSNHCHLQTSCMSWTKSHKMCWWWEPSYLSVTSFIVLSIPALVTPLLFSFVSLFFFQDHLLNVLFLMHNHFCFSCVIKYCLQCCLLEECILTLSVCTRQFSTPRRQVFQGISLLFQELQKIYPLPHFACCSHIPPSSF